MMTFEEDLINEVRSRPVVWNKQCEDYKNRLKCERAWDIIARNLNKSKNDVKTRWRHLRDVFLKEVKKISKPCPRDTENPDEPGYPGKWAYYHHMLFLKEVSTPRQIEINIVPQENEINDTEAGQTFDNLKPEPNYRIPDECSTAWSNKTEVTSSDDEPIVARTHEKNSGVISNETVDSKSQIEPKKKKYKGNQSNLTEYERQMIQIEKDKIKAFKEKERDVENEDILFLKSLAPYFKYLNAVQKLRLKSKLQTVIADEIAVAMQSPLFHSSLQFYESLSDNKDANN